MILDLRLQISMKANNISTFTITFKHWFVLKLQGACLDYLKLILF